MNSDLLTVAQLALGIAILIAEGVALWLTVEGIYWVWCKATGKEY